MCNFAFVMVAKKGIQFLVKINITCADLAILCGYFIVFSDLCGLFP
jgi:hypothetical protein